MNKINGYINGVQIDIEFRPEARYSVENHMHSINISQFKKERLHNDFDFDREYNLFSKHVDEILLEDDSRLEYFNVIGIGETIQKNSEKHHTIKDNIVYTIEYNSNNKIAYIYMQGVIEFLQVNKKILKEDELIIDKKDRMGMDIQDSLYWLTERARLIECLEHYLKNGEST